MFTYLYRKFINDGMNKKAASYLAKEIELRPIIDKRCKSCKSKECFNGKYGPFCPEGREE